MFLNQTIKKNPALIEAAFTLHKSGRVQPDSYLIDVDTMLMNAAGILNEADKYGIRLYFMLKQVGRNPYLAKKLIDMGYIGAVCVDYREAQVMMDAGIPIGNVGHLVQVPDAMVSKIVEYRPELITVYSFEKIKVIQEACARQNVKQDIMIRIYGMEDDIYSGQTAGFFVEELPELIGEIKTNCPDINIKGVTSFPCFLYDEELGDIRPTNNLTTVMTAVKILKAEGILVEVINTPSATCIHSMKMIHQYGGNCGEPGHGMTGTTPMHVCHDLAELPAVVYISEISHNFMGQAYCFGGGYYRRSHVEQALIGQSIGSAKVLSVIPPAPEAIDYHMGISGECQIGDTAVMAFRFQMFVCRSDVVLVEGLRSGRPEIAAVYDSAGRKKG